MTDFRTLGHSVVPSFISSGQEDRSDSAKVWHTHLTMLDHQTERAYQGAMAKFPDFAPDDAIPMICKDRGIVRGFAEPRPSINFRLKNWWDSWKRVGNAFALMDEIAGYLTGYAVRLRTVDNTGNWYTREPDGSTSYLWAQANWDWDSVENVDAAASWWRAWLIIYPLATGLWPIPPTCGSGEKCGQTGHVLGSDVATVDNVSSIREIVRRRKPAGVHEIFTIIAYDEASFAPATPEPNGKWKNDGFYVSGVCRPARLLSARYWQGTDEKTIEVTGA